MFKSLKVTDVQEAFAIAHKAGNDPNCPAFYRAKFKRIANKIWEACGEEKEMPTQLPTEMEDMVNRMYVEVHPRRFPANTEDKKGGR